MCATTTRLTMVIELPDERKQVAVVKEPRYHLLLKQIEALDHERVPVRRPAHDVARARLVHHGEGPVQEGRQRPDAGRPRLALDLCLPAHPIPVPRSRGRG